MGLESSNVNNFDAIIEISTYGSVKYEYNQKSQILTVDRFIFTAVRYPCNYGFVPDTLAEDGDPLDVLVVTPTPVQSGTAIQVRAVGLMRMEDETGRDNKILAFPLEKACREYRFIRSIEDVSPLLLDNISHFFTHYKDLEPNKWSKVYGWENKDAAEKELQSSRRKNLKKDL
ncbi:inorganic diphosphatase [Coxiella endosymbiont of Amblyomma sculptum]|uniref:inorganic diphosphatase n=1 Tax=Coxiella endosymbiont of Amblyomma sculptum TaxID=2487929 RepID=UPI00132E7DAD|nr:inorganic diphosphatase [Coxiella endosymbiont of Amblyomma sculptum]QHG92345.1 inorganic diphosphatase [Coxiella endosymbiont of Amblyomma sculptum]